MLPYLVFFSDSLIIGLKFVVPVIFILNAFGSPALKSRLGLLNLNSAWLIITAGALFTAVIAFNTLQAWHSGNEAERDFLISIATGPNWYQLLVPAFNFTVLPLVLWFRKPRHSFYASFIIVVTWILSYFWVDYLSPHIGKPHGFRDSTDWHEYTSKAILFAVAFAAGWLLLMARSRRQNAPRVKS